MLTASGQRMFPTPPVSVAPVLTHLAQTHTSWREGTALALIARSARRRAPVGTSFSFRLNEPAGLTFAFNQSVRGRRTHGRCVAETNTNRKSPACRRVVTQGTLRLTGHAGMNRITFQGRFSRAGTLKRGRYTLVLTAMNGPASVRVPARSPSPSSK